MNIPNGNLHVGSHNNYVRDLQRELNAAGFNAGPADGVFGAHTQAAVRAFQRKHHLAVDGIAGHNTWAALGGDRFEGSSQASSAPKSAAIPNVVLRRGSHSSYVQDLQRELNAAGFNVGAADGVFGAHTDAAVRAFQRKHHLTVDGVVGHQTWAALGGDRYASTHQTSAVGGSSSKEHALAAAARQVAMGMGGYHSEGLCATGVSRAISRALHISVSGNGNQIDNNLPRSHFRQINISLAQALKTPGLILTWEHTSTPAGRIYGHTAVTLGDGHSSASDFIENNTLAGAASRSGLKIFEPI